MAFSLTCPDCSSKLKTATAIPIGKDVQCPKCKTKFKVSNENMEEVADTKAAPAKAAAVPTKAAASKAPAAPTPAARRTRDEDADDDNPFGAMGDAPAKKRIDDDEDESQRSRRRLSDDENDDKPRKKARGDDDEDEAPKSRRRSDDDEDEAPKARKRRGDEEDESPRSRKRRDEEEEDDTPKSRKRGGDDEEDDAPKSRRRGSADDENEDKPRRKGRGDDDEDESPRSRRRGIDDDEDDDRPRRGGRGRGGRSKTGNKKLLIYGGIGLLAVAGLVILLFMLFGGSGSYDKEMAAYIPDNTAMVVGVDVEKLMEVDLIKGFIDKGIPGGGNELDIIKKAGLTFGDVSKAMLAMGEPGKNKSAPDSGMAVVRFKKTIDKAKVISAVGATEVKGAKAYYKTKDLCLYFPKDDLIVVASGEDVMRKIVEKEEKVTLNETLQEMMGKVSGGNVWIATSMNPMSSGPLGGMGNQMAGLDPDAANAVKGAKAFGLLVDIDNKNFKVKVVVKCGDSGAASKAEGALNKKLKEAQDMLKAMPSGAGGAQMDAIKDILNSTDVSASGDVFEASVKGSYAPLVDMVKPFLQMGGGNPFGGGGNPFGGGGGGARPPDKMFRK